jgi:hypothetical protein
LMQRLLAQPQQDRSHKARQPQQLHQQSKCHNPAKFIFPPLPLSGPSAAAPAPLAQNYNVHPTYYAAPAQPPVQLSPLSYYQDTVPLHIPETSGYAPNAPKPTRGYGDMQGSPMSHTTSPDSDELPFHPKYLDVPGHKAISPREF